VTRKAQRFGCCINATLERAVCAGGRGLVAVAGRHRLVASGPD